MHISTFCTGSYRDLQGLAKNPSDEFIDLLGSKYSRSSLKCDHVMFLGAALVAVKGRKEASQSSKLDGGI